MTVLSWPSEDHVLEKLHFTATGRGRNYTWKRGLLESALRVAYTGDWPAKVWGVVPGATAVRVVHESVPLPAEKALAAPLRVAFASDLHVGPTTPDALLDAAFARIAAARPDLLVLGGDYVFLDATPARAARLAELVERVPAKRKVAVLGNHDLWTHHGRLEDALARAGVTVLVNGAVRLDPPHHEVAVVGLDDPWTGHPDGDAAFAGAAGAKVTIAVCHEPDGFAWTRGRGASLFLSGHTHGGHMALPGHRPLIIPGGEYSRKWPHGLHREDGAVVFVSRGVGGVEVPVRTWAPPDVGVFDLA